MLCVVIYMDIEWRQQYEYTDYWVSNNGQVMSRKFGKERVLKAGLNRCGYLTVAICQNGTQTTKTVHSLVAHCFLGPRPSPEMVIDHIDRVKTNNHVSNLRYVSIRDNRRNSGDYKENILETRGNTFLVRCSENGKSKSRMFKTREEAEYCVHRLDIDKSYIDEFKPNRNPIGFGNIVERGGSFRGQIMFNKKVFVKSFPTHREAHEYINSVRVEHGLELVSYEDRLNAKHLSQ
jgi:hypothetical protein